MATIIFLPMYMPCIFFLSFTSSLFTPTSSSSSSSYIYQRDLQSNSPQNIETLFHYRTNPAFSTPSNSPPPSPFNQPSETPTSPLIPTKVPATLQPPTKSSGSTKAVVATAACTVIFAGVFFFFLHKYVLVHRGEKQADKSHQTDLRDNRSVSIDPSKLLNGNLKGMIIDENGMDVLYWRKLEEGGDVRNGLCRGVLGPQNEEKRQSGEAVMDSNYDHVSKIQSYVNSSSRVLPESEYTVCFPSPPGPNSNYWNYYTKTPLESRDPNCVFSHLSAKSLNPLSPIQKKFRDTKRVLSHPSSNYSKFSSRIRSETEDPDRVLFPGSKVTAANSLTMAMARARTQAPIPPPPPLKSEPLQSSPHSTLPPAAVLYTSPASPVANKNSIAPFSSPQARDLKPLQSNSIKVSDPLSMDSLKGSRVGQMKHKPLSHWDKVFAKPEHSK